MAVNKVCHITSVHYRYDVRILDKECVSLSNAGYEVVLLVNDQLEPETHQGVKVNSVGSVARNRLTRVLSAKRKFLQEAMKVNAHIYHFHDPELLPLGMKLKRHGKIVIYDSHEDVPRQILAKTWIPKWIRKPVSYFYEKYENRIVKRLDAVIVPTPHIRDRFLSINKNTTIVANFPLIKEFPETFMPKERKEQACYVGGITHHRGILQIAEATQRVNIKLVLCGRFESENLKEEILRKYSHIEYRGLVNRALVSEVICESQMGLVTLLYTPNHYYSYPIKMFEYMAGGIPVIASNFPLWKSIIEGNKCGICVNPESVDDITVAIKSIQDEREQARDMGIRGREKVLTKYNWEEQAIELLSLYKKLFDRL